MSATYTFTQNINDTGLLSTYISSVIQNLSGVNYNPATQLVQLVFSTALNAANVTALNALMAAYNDPQTTDEMTDANISPYNSSNAALAAAGVFTGAWEDVSHFSSVRVSFTSNAVSTIGGVSLQFGISNKQVDIARNYTLAVANAKYTQYCAVPGRYFRILYTNGATSQTSFSLATFWSHASAQPVVQASEILLDSNDMALTRSVLAGRSDYAQYNNIRTDEQGLLWTRDNKNFGRSVAADSNPIIQVSFTYGVNTYTTSTTVAMSGTVTGSGGRAIVSTAAAANSSATIISERFCRCGPPNTLTAVISCAFTAGVAGSIQLAGVGDAQNGMFFGYNGTVFGAMIRSSAVSNWIPQTSFNIDTVNGTGNSGVLLNPTKGNTYVIMFDAVGFSSIQFMLQNPISVTQPAVSLSECIFLHRASTSNTLDTLTLANPQLPLMVSAQNTTNLSAITIKVASMSAFLDAPLLRPRIMRGWDTFKSITTTIYAPVTIFQNKVTYGGVNNATTMHLREISVACSGASRNLVVAIIQDATLASTTFNDIDTANSSISVSDVGTMTANTGTLIWTGTLYSTSAQWDLHDDEILLKPGSTLTVAAKASVATTINVTVASVFAELQ